MQAIKQNGYKTRQCERHARENNIKHAKRCEKQAKIKHRKSHAMQGYDKQRGRQIQAKNKQCNCKSKTSKKPRIVGVRQAKVKANLDEKTSDAEVKAKPRKKPHNAGV